MKIDNLKPWHPGMYYAGQTTEWMPTDSEESFEKLVQDPKHYKYFQEQCYHE